MKAVEDGIGPNASAPALLAKAEIWHDVYVGTAEDLTRAGLARGDMFPGQPGRGKIQCSFDMRPGPHCGSGRRKLVIRRRGKERFEVSWPVGDDEGERRRKAWHAARAAEQAKRQAASEFSAEEAGAIRGALTFALGNAFIRAYDASPARFKVGDRATYCYFDGARCAVEIVGAFHEYHVTNEGRHRLGYAVRDDEGQEFFAAAHSLLCDDYRVRHLMLVQGHRQASSHAKHEDGPGRWL